MDSLKEKLETYKKQQEQARVVFLKCEAIIGFIESELQEQESSKKDKKK